MIYLYVKVHLVTGMKYFGKTAAKNPYVYLGSGKYWLRHIRSHGKFIKTIDVWGFDDVDMCSEFALKFSHDNNIVSSKSWANLMPEDGLRGIPAGTIFESRRGVKKGPHTEETKQKIREAHAGKKRKPHTEETKLKMREAALGEKNHNYGQKRTDESRALQSIALKGRIVTDETRQRMSDARKNYYKDNSPKPITEETRQKLRDAHTRRRSDRNDILAKITDVCELKDGLHISLFHSRPTVEI